MKRNYWLILIAILVIIVIVAVSNSRTSEKIKIGVLTPLSGALSVSGEVQKKAIEIFTDDLLAKGSNLDKYEFVYEDSKYDPKTSVSGYEALKLKGVKIIIADGSPVVAAIREKAVQDGILVFAQSATTPAFTDQSPLTCRIGITADILGPSISEVALNKFGYKNIALLVQNNEYGKTMQAEIAKSYKGNITMVEYFDPTVGDFRTSITKLLTTKKTTDALVVINNITPEQIYKQLKELGWDKPILSDIWTITSPKMTDRTVAAGVNFVDYEYSPQVDLNKNEGAKNYAVKYQNKFNTSPILLGALTYDSFNILINTINKVGGDPADISKELLNIHSYQGITGIVNFDSSCQNINKNVVWRTVKADGSFANI